MPETVAFIDVGTNSIHMLIVGFYPGSTGTPIFQDKESVRMGKSLYECGRIDEETLGKARVVLSKFADIARGYNVTDIIAMATCAAREAPNREELVAVAKECGIDLRVIPGKEEARITRLGVAGPVCSSKTLCIDVGGGSTEIALAEGTEDLYLDSLSLGAIRMAFGSGIDQRGKVSQKQYESLRRLVDAQCYHTVGILHQKGFDKVMGSSGTIEALADACAMRRGDGDATYLIHSELRSLMKLMCSMTAEERCKLPKVSPNRADIVIGGGVIVDELMELLGIERLTVSRAGLREGMKNDYLLAHGHSDFNVRASSVKALAARCGCDTGHEVTVRRLASKLYSELTRNGLMPESDKMAELLGYAAQLHDVGSFISYEKHNVFSYTIIRNSYLAGFDSAELEKIALLARFHHNSFPGRGSKYLSGFDDDTSMSIRRYALILKIADILDRGRDSAVEDIGMEVLNDNANLTLFVRSDVSLVLWKLNSIGSDFESLFVHRFQVRVHNIN